LRQIDVGVASGTIGEGSSRISRRIAHALSIASGHSKAELVLDQARNSEYQSLVQLYKAFGGG
jgi:hypothetical protein